MSIALLPFAIACGLTLILGAAQWLHRRPAPDSAVFPELNGEG